MCRTLNDEGILGRAARDSLSRAALEFRNWPTTSALPHCPYTMGRVAAVLLSSNLIPAGSPDIWLGCQISNDLTTATHPVVDDNGTLQDPQPYPPTHDVLHRLTPLWKHDIHNWDQVLYHPRGSVPHILTMEEFNNRQSLLGLPPPTPALTRAPKYLHCLLLSSSLSEFRSLRCSLTKKKLHPTMSIAHSGGVASLSFPTCPPPRSLPHPRECPVNSHSTLSYDQSPPSRRLSQDPTARPHRHGPSPDPPSAADRARLPLSALSLPPSGDQTSRGNSRLSSPSRQPDNIPCQKHACHPGTANDDTTSSSDST